jgi:hypothetical protein
MEGKPIEFEGSSGGLVEKGFPADIEVSRTRVFDNKEVGDVGSATSPEAILFGLRECGVARIGASSGTLGIDVDESRPGVLGRRRPREDGVAAWDGK